MTSGDGSPHAASPDRIDRAAGGAGREVSWREMVTRAAAAAAGLVRLGVEPGDRVSMLANTRKRLDALYE